MKKSFFIFFIYLCAPLFSQENVLQEIIDSVIENDLTIQKKHQETLIALEEYQLSAAQLFPEIDLNIDPALAHSSTTEEIAPSIAETISTINNNISLDYLQQLPSGGKIFLQVKNSMTTASLENGETLITQEPEFNFNYKQPLFINGKIMDWELIPSQIKSSYSKYESALLSEHEHRSRRIIDALKTYSTCYFSKQKKNYLEKKLSYHQLVLRKLTEKEKAGLITIKELWEQEITVSSVEIELQKAIVDYSQNILLLKQNTGFQSLELQILNTPEIELSHIPSEENLSVLEELPVLKEAKKQISYILAQTQITDLKYSPQLNLGLTLSPYYGSNREDASKIENSIGDFFKDNAGINYSASIGISIPIYQGGKDVYDRNKDKALVEQAVLSYEENLKLIQNQYQNLLQQLEIQKNNYQLLLRQHDLNIKRWEDSRELLAMGYITSVESKLPLLEKVNSSIMLEEAAINLFLSKLELRLFIGEDIYKILRE